MCKVAWISILDCFGWSSQSVVLALNMSHCAAVKPNWARPPYCGWVFVQAMSASEFCWYVFLKLGRRQGKPIWNLTWRLYGVLGIYICSHWCWGVVDSAGFCLQAPLVLAQCRLHVISAVLFGQCICVWIARSLNWFCSYQLFGKRVSIDVYIANMSNVYAYLHL